VTSCRVAALATAMIRDDDDEFSFLTTILYALVILKNSTDFLAARS
jgi:hypothetical protein